MDDASKFSAEAKSGLFRMISEMGLEKGGKFAENKAKGATEAFMMMKKLALMDGVKIEGVEYGRVINLATQKYHRTVDLVVSVNGRTINIEVKAWNPNRERGMAGFADSLWSSMKRQPVVEDGEVIEGMTQGKLGQAFADMAENLSVAFKKTDDELGTTYIDESKLLNVLQFDGRFTEANKAELIELFRKKFEEGYSGELNTLIKATGNPELDKISKGTNGETEVLKILEELLQKSIYNADSLKTYIGGL
ncbi:hypothetical Protein YC6258_00800 [Gynuella sunshinyii YC6258]|uniref:Uncharacterized protein n=2 Tax=Gynuella sunshinyii TaxID=1445505 RepID=A0A0C5UZX0_9GAMM|nr:hypothetical Protein YC6258_00800 [Gynuella sunshinyii YC6258]